MSCAFKATCTSPSLRPSRLAAPCGAGRRSHWPAPRCWRSCRHPGGPSGIQNEAPKCTAHDWLEAIVVGIVVRSDTTVRWWWYNRGRTTVEIQWEFLVEGFRMPFQGGYQVGQHQIHWDMVRTSLNAKVFRKSQRPAAALKGGSNFCRDSWQRLWTQTIKHLACDDLPNTDKNSSSKHHLIILHTYQ